MLFDDCEYEDSKVPMGSDCYALTDGLAAEIPSLGITMVGGIVYQKYEDGTYQPDWNVTFIYKTGESPKEYLYYEQDGYETTLHNYCTGRPGYSVTADTKCVIRRK